MPRRNSHSDNWEFGSAPPREESARPEPKPRLRKAATTIAFTTLFFSGAALTAVAGDKFSHLSADDAALEETATEAAPPAEAPAAPAETPASAAEPAPAPAPAPEAAPEAAPETAPEAAPAADPVAAPAEDPAASGSEDPAASGSEDPTAAPATEEAAQESAPADSASAPAEAPSSDAAAAPAAKPRVAKSRKTRAAHARASKLVLLPAVKPAPDPEIEGPPAGATVWLNSPTLDPTPPAKRLSAAFARRLTATAKGNGLDWAFVLGVLRAKGITGKDPIDAVTLRKLSSRLSDVHEDHSAWAAALAYGGSSEFADRAVALMRYDRAIGLHALVHGLQADKARLAARLLADPQVSIYEGGRQDIVRGRVDVRVLAVIAYLHEAYGQITVSCLISGHHLYARPGVVSAHIYGRAVDISSLGGQSILGNSAPGGLTEHAVRDILLLPHEVMPQQVISLLGLGGPSFPLANHADHIHVGF